MARNEKDVAGAFERIAKTKQLEKLDEQYHAIAEDLGTLTAKTRATTRPASTVSEPGVIYINESYNLKTDD